MANFFTAILLLFQYYSTNCVKTFSLAVVTNPYITGVCRHLIAFFINTRLLTLKSCNDLRNEDIKYVLLDLFCRAAALYKDKIDTESRGESWSEASSSARNHKSSVSLASRSSSAAKSSSGSSGMASSQSFSNFSSNSGGGGAGGYQGAPDFNSHEFKAQKEDFFSRKQGENAMRRDDIPPSQGGKYAGFGSSCNAPPPRSFSAQDMVGSSLGGLTSSISNMGLGNLGGKVAEVGWKFTSLAGQKAAELSEGVTEKVGPYGSLCLGIIIARLTKNCIAYIDDDR